MYLFRRCIPKRERHSQTGFGLNRSQFDPLGSLINLLAIPGYFWLILAIIASEITNPNQRANDRENAKIVANAEKEAASKELSDKASEIVADSEGSPNELIKVSDNMFIAYDPSGEQFLVYSSLESAKSDEHDDLYYREETQNLEDVIIDKLKQDRDMGL